MFWQVSGARLTSGSGLAALLLALFGISVSASGLILLGLQVIIHVFTLIKNKIKFFSYIRKFRVEQLQCHIWLTASLSMGKYLRISSYIRKPFLIYDFATASLWISLYMRKIWFSFLSVHHTVEHQQHELLSTAKNQLPKNWQQIFPENGIARPLS